mmetsp:Transcript_29776/g.88165  ORF Transcript_29776/g.88165 Transcript_29776/m.88165 type:complete len:427 (+) Transcript_29776:2001-3281(+)
MGSSSSPMRAHTRASSSSASNTSARMKSAVNHSHGTRKAMRHEPNVSRSTCRATNSSARYSRSRVEPSTRSLRSLRQSSTVVAAHTTQNGVKMSRMLVWSSTPAASASQKKHLTMSIAALSSAAVSASIAWERSRARCRSRYCACSPGLAVSGGGGPIWRYTIPGALIMSTTWTGMSMTWFSSAGINTTHHDVSPKWPTSLNRISSTNTELVNHTDVVCASSTRLSMRSRDGVSTSGCEARPPAAPLPAALGERANSAARARSDAGSPAAAFERPAEVLDGVVVWLLPLKLLLAGAAPRLPKPPASSAPLGLRTCSTGAVADALLVSGAAEANELVAAAVAAASGAAGGAAVEASTSSPRLLLLFLPLLPPRLPANVNGLVSSAGGERAVETSSYAGAAPTPSRGDAMLGLELQVPKRKPRLSFPA